MRVSAVVVVSLAAVVVAGPMKLYEKSPDETYKQGETGEEFGRGEGDRVK